MTRSKISSLIAQALGQQIAIDNQTSTRAVKFAYTKGLKHGSTKQDDPRQSLSLEMEKVDYGNSVTATVRVCYNRHLCKDLYCAR